MVYLPADGYPFLASHGRESRPVDHKSDALTTKLPNHPVCRSRVIVFLVASLQFPFQLFSVMFGFFVLD